eukprot:5127018-Amphidinium_carterae.1
MIETPFHSGYNSAGGGEAENEGTVGHCLTSLTKLAFHPTRIGNDMCDIVDQNKKTHKGIVHKGIFHNNGKSKYSKHA